MTMHNKKNNNITLHGSSSRTPDSGCQRITTQENDHNNKEKGIFSSIHFREFTKQYVHFISTICITFIVSTTTLANDTTPETCANEAGTVIIGAVTGQKYCMSNKSMNWWNAYAWCDGIGSTLFSMNDCKFSGTNTSICANLKNTGNDVWIWTSTPNGSTNAYGINLSSGNFGNFAVRNHPHGGYRALCH